jgi:Tfp pilus assembly protein PilF
LAFKFGFEAEAAIIAASIFAVHPLHVEAVTNIVGRAELLMSAGVLGSLLLATKEKWGLSMLAFAVGLFSKEQAMVLPFLLFLAMQCQCLNAKGEGLSQLSGARSLLFSRFIAYFLILAAYVVMRGHALGSLQLSRTGFLENPLVSADWLTRISTAVAVAGRYLWLSIWPSTLSADYSYNAVPLVHSLGDPRFWVSIAAWAALIMIGVWTRSGDRRGGFFIGLVILPFLPVSNLVFPIGTIMGERLFYLPSAGLALLVGWGWQRAIAGVGTRPASHRHSGPLHLAALTVLAIIITAMMVRTVVRNQDWTDSETLHRRTIQLFPENARVHEYLGDLVMRKGDLTQAYNLYRTALRIYPEYPQVSFVFASNFGVLLRRLGKPKEAVEWLEKAAALNPRWSVLRVNLGNVYFDQGRLSEAASNYQQALALNPAPVEPRVNLSLVRSAQGQYAEALDLADGAIRRNAGFPLGHYARAQACEGLGLKEEAIKSYRQTLQLDSAFAEAEERLRALSVSAMS